jgi:hypothetical protein
MSACALSLFLHIVGAFVSGPGEPSVAMVLYPGPRGRHAGPHSAQARQARLRRLNLPRRTPLGWGARTTVYGRVQLGDWR